MLFTDTLLKNDNNIHEEATDRHRHLTYLIYNLKRLDVWYKKQTVYETQSYVKSHVIKYKKT